MLFGSSGKQKKTSTEGDKVKGVNKAKARIQECVTARVRIIRAAFEPGDFKYEASQECISIATVMTLRTISSVAALLCLQGSMHIATLALWMVLAASSGWCLPPFHDFLQLLFQSVLFVLREFQVFQPLLVLCLGQRRRLVVHKPWIDRSRGDQ